jgi:hypothetical protein
MTFLNPILAVVGVACVAIPIIIHILMRRRRRPVAWGAMQFLLEAYRRQRRRINLEQLLLLACRCLLVLLLALALGKPVLEAAGAAPALSARTLFILLDNSLPAAGPVEAGTQGLESSKRLAEELLAGLDASRGDRAALVTLGGPADAQAWPPSADLAMVRSALAATTLTDSRIDLAGGLSRVRDEAARLRAQGGRAGVALLSAWRQGSVDLGTPLTGADTGADLLVQTPTASPIDNIAVAALRPARRVILPRAEGDPTLAATFAVDLARWGPGVGSAGVSSVVVEVQRPGEARSAGRGQAVVAWAPGQAAHSAMIEVEFPAESASRGRLIAVARIDRDAIEGDNAFRMPLEARDRLTVLLVAAPRTPDPGLEGFAPADWLALALQPGADPQTRRRQESDIRVEAIDPARLGNSGIAGDVDAVIITAPDEVPEQGWAAVRSVADRGGLVMVVPPHAAQTHTWPDAMNGALGLHATFAREAVTLDPPAAPAPTPGPGGADLLEVVAPELPELVKAVRVTRVLPVTSQAGTFEPVLSLDDGRPALVTIPRSGDGAQAGLVLVWCVSPDLAWTDLPTKPLMVPLVQELVRQGTGRAARPSTAYAGLTPPPMGEAIELALVAGAGGDDPAAPGVRSLVRVEAGVPAFPIRRAGTYTLRNAAGVSTGLLSFNADTSASATGTVGEDELSRWLSPAGSSLRWLRPGDVDAGAGGGGPSGTPPMSLPLLAAALAVAGCEALLARFFSHAHREGRP